MTAAGQLSSAGELAFVSAWHEHDGIGVATVAYPFRANTNEGTRLVDAAGKRIDVDAVQLDDTVRADPGVQALLAAHRQPRSRRRRRAAVRRWTMAGYDCCTARRCATAMPAPTSGRFRSATTLMERGISSGSRWCRWLDRKSVV